jgi:hypothetical protein
MGEGAELNTRKPIEMPAVNSSILSSNTAEFVKSKGITEAMISAIETQNYSIKGSSRDQKINAFLNILDRVKEHAGKKDWLLPHVKTVDSVELDKDGRLKITIQVTHTNMPIGPDGNMKKNPDGSYAMDKTPYTKQISFTYSDQNNSFKITDVKPVEKNQIVQS